MKKVRFCYYCFSSNCIKGLLFSSKGLALRPSNIFFCIPLTLNFKGAGEMTKQNPPLNTDTVLWWLQPTNEMDLASGFETYLTAYCSYQNKKESENEKHKKTKTVRAYAEVPEGETEVWAICTGLSSGSENKQALSEALETFLLAGIALFGLTAWGLNPQEGLRFFHVPWSVKKKGQLLSKIILIFGFLSPFLQF